MTDGRTDDVDVVVSRACFVSGGRLVCRFDVSAVDGCFVGTPRGGRGVGSAIRVILWGRFPR